MDNEVVKIIEGADNKDDAKRKVAAYFDEKKVAQDSPQRQGAVDMINGADPNAEASGDGSGESSDEVKKTSENETSTDEEKSDTDPPVEGADPAQEGTKTE